MKVLYVGLARVLWLFDTPLWNPGGISLQPMLQKLAEQYQFAQAPKNALDLNDQQALAFKSGTFMNSKGVPVVIGFSIYKDGLVADTLSSTDDSTQFLSETVDWIRKEFGLAVPPNVRRGYLSQVDFECDTPLVALNPNLVTFLRLLEERFQPIDGKRRVFDVAGLSCWTEDITQPLAPGAFKFERKVAAPFSTNHYFSQAPVETAMHLELLNQLERILKT